MSAEEFECFVAELLSQMGWHVVVTPASHDGGRDVIVTASTPTGDLLHLVEIKKNAPHRAVGVADVRTLYGVLCDSGATTAILLTTSRFTRDAKRFAQSHPWRLHLVDGELLLHWLSDHRSNATPSAQIADDAWEDRPRSLTWV
jgi:restriction endonuclease Mrr